LFARAIEGSVKAPRTQNPGERIMKVKLIFPAREVEYTAAMIPTMPIGITILAALTPPEVELKLVDMTQGDDVGYDDGDTLVGITVRTPLATRAYEIADNFRSRGVKVCLGGPHASILPEDAIQHADSVVIGEAEALWPELVRDMQRNQLKKFYVAGPFATDSLPGEYYHSKERPDLSIVPKARRDLLPRERYWMDGIQTTRGCPNRCRFCPVTCLFGGKIRHRPIPDVVEEVDSLRDFYFNADDSVFGHPQLVDRGEENQYYLDLYSELARLKKKRNWRGAGGISAVNYKNGRKILEKAAESGLASISAGLESITSQGQMESGAWRKLHAKNANSFELEKVKENIRVIQDFGIEILGFFVIGWDSDTVETYYRTLDFCEEMRIMPVIFTLVPTPGSDVYEEYKSKGRLHTDLPWSDFDTGKVVFDHPLMSKQEMMDANREVMRQAYSLDRIFLRSLHNFAKKPNEWLALGSFQSQLAIRQAFAKIYGFDPSS
jgi:radical SAM superfamily enzyme YgiQ (UPF0313 family)